MPDHNRLLTRPYINGKVIHVRADGTIVQSMKGVEIPPDNGYYDVLARMAERMRREGITVYGLAHDKQIGA